MTPRMGASTELATADLAQCVAVVDAGLATFVEVGQALARIRDGKLYQETHETFEAFCKERWDMGRQHAYELIGASGVVQNVRHGVQGLPTLPTSERQARPLTRLEPDYQPGVWQGVVEDAKAEGVPVTAARVEAAVDEFQGKGKPKPKAKGKDEWTEGRAIAVLDRAVNGALECIPAKWWGACGERLVAHGKETLAVVASESDEG